MNDTLSAPGPFDAEDADVVGDLRELYRRLDPVPATLTDRIKYAMTVRLLEAEVAELTRMPAAVVRSESGDTFDSISFSGSRLSLMVSLSPAATDETALEDEPGGIRVDCWVSVGEAAVEIRPAGQAAGPTQVCDENGRCVFPNVSRGPVHFIVWPTAVKDSPPTMTPTIDL